MVIVIDADGLVVGRMATKIANRLMKGEEIVIINAEKAIISGSRKAIIEEFKHRRDVGSERKGPYYPKMPDRILRRSVRGMIPHKRASGKNALHRLQVYIGVPSEFASSKPETIESAKKPLIREYMRLGEISKVLGVDL